MYTTKFYAHGKIVRFPKKHPAEPSLQISSESKQSSVDGAELLGWLDANWEAPPPIAQKSVRQACERKGGIDPEKPRKIGGTARDAIRARGFLGADSRFLRDSLLLFYTFSVPAGLAGRDPRTDHPRLLAVFRKALENLRRRHGVREYLWTAEAQKNGQVHFHCLIWQDRKEFLNIRHVNFYWCRLLAEIGINTVVPEKRRKMLLTATGDSVDLLCRGPQSWAHWFDGLSPFEAGFPKVWLDMVYPAVDCRRVTSPNAVSKYMTKYVTKSSTESPPVYCTRWAMSRGLVALSGVVKIDSDHMDERPDTYERWGTVVQYGDWTTAWVAITYVDPGVLQTSEFEDVKRVFDALLASAA